MKNAVVEKLVQIVIVLVGISLITFALVMLGPGDIAKQILTGGEDIIVSAEQVEALRHELGLDQPFLVQYGMWASKAIRGDLGISFMAKQPVLEVIMSRLPATVLLAVASLVFMMVVAVPMGIYSAVHQNGWIDYVLRGITFMGVSVPNFWLGLMMLYVLGLKLGLLPIVGGRVSAETLVMPALTLGIAMASKYMRQVRAIVLEELHQDYVTGCRARGMSESHILCRCGDGI